MKITVYYEDNRERMTIEVPDADCEIWVETDYQQRLMAAEDKAAVTRRTPQEIMDEECNKPTYNSHHRNTRRHVSFDALDPQGDTVPGAADIDLGLPPDCFDDLYRAIDMLSEKQRTTLRKVFFEGLKQVDIARAEGVSEAAVTERMKAAINKLRKILEKKNDFPKP